jgi:hypothetical protein
LSTIAAELPTRHNNNGDCLVQYSIFTERNMNYLPLPEPPPDVTTTAVTSPDVANSALIASAQVAPQ